MLGRSIVIAGLGAMALVSSVHAQTALEPVACMPTPTTDGSVDLLCGNGSEYVLYQDGSVLIHDTAGVRAALQAGADGPKSVWFVDTDLSYWTLTVGDDGVTLREL